ncbi:MAG: ABC transporter permease, partial [Paraburkholderia hospita]
MSTPLTPIDQIRAASARSAGLRWTLRVLRWVLTLAITFTGLLAVTFVIGRKVPIDPVL